MKFLVVFLLTLASALSGKLEKARIFKGEKAVEGEFPSIVLLSIVKHGFNFECGGSLISSEWILTAAHCLHNMDSGTAFLGAITQGKAAHKIPFSDDDVIVHEEASPVENDIALIHIKPVELSDAVSPIKLANGSVTYDNSKAIAVGWGRTSDDSTGSQDLLYATVIVEPSSECIEEFWELPESSICTSTKSGSSPCQGDSGGPLISRLDGKLIGVTSFASPKGCQQGSPVVFTRVASFLDWIESETGLKLK